MYSPLCLTQVSHTFCTFHALCPWPCARLCARHTPLGAPAALPAAPFPAERAESRRRSARGCAGLYAASRSLLRGCVQGQR